MTVEERLPEAIEALVADGAPSDEALDRFFSEGDFPLVDGTKVTFVYRGNADTVRLQHWIHGLPTAQPFHRVPGTDLWWRQMSLRRGSRVEYKFFVERENHAELIRDPYNERMAHDPFGANSVVFVEGYERPEWTHEDREARKGKLEEHLIASTAFGEVRKFRVYVPARFRTNRRHPLLIVHDGRDFLNFAGLQTVLDNLIHRYEIPPTVVALLDSDDRLNEYANNEQHARFVVEELVPAMSELYPLHDRPDARVLMGASFGAVATLSTAWRYQGTFGKLLLQSGSFAFTDIGEHDRGPVFDPVVRFVNAFRDDPGRPAEQVHVSCGIYERLIYENRSLVPLLQSAGMSVRFEESRDGHDWENWRDRLRGGLSWLLPGPLWFVYE